MLVEEIVCHTRPFTLVRPEANAHLHPCRPSQQAVDKEQREITQSPTAASLYPARQALPSSSEDL